MPNKLTDAEVKKALGCCADVNSICETCILFNPKDDDCKCSRVLKRNALDLINRYEEEKTELLEKIEQLRKDKVLLSSEISRLNSVNQMNENHIQKLSHKCDDCAGCTSWKCDCANIEAEAYKKCIDAVKEEIKQALESNHKAKHEHIEKHYQCLSCDFLATVRGKIDALSGLDYFLNELLNNLMGDGND